ncbi:MAG TPA: hypothetical protein VK013_14020 [Myxococcaceae bacterium]|nr:hypothetical protein [Myxococcaceae bacterium]
MSPAARQPSLFLEFLPDDVVLMRPGAGEGEELSVTAKRLEERAEQGRFFLIVDFSDMAGGIDSATRERGSDLIKVEWMRACIYINASMPIRAALKVINLAMFLSGRADFPTEYVKSMEEAHETVARLRAEGH